MKLPGRPSRPGKPGSPREPGRPSAPGNPGKPRFPTGPGSPFCPTKEINTQIFFNKNDERNELNTNNHHGNPKRSHRYHHHHHPSLKSNEHSVTVPTLYLILPFLTNAYLSILEYTDINKHY